MMDLMELNLDELTPEPEAYLHQHRGSPKPVSQTPTAAAAVLLRGAEPVICATNVRLLMQWYCSAFQCSAWHVQS